MGLTNRARRRRRRRDGTRSAIDHCLVVETDSIHRIQECHVAIYHILWDLVHTLLARRPRLAAGRRSNGKRGSAMKYVDEFRDPEKAKILLREIDALGRDSIECCTEPAAPDHGGVRRPHPRDLPLRHRGHAARRDRAGARPRLSGLRAADGPRRRLRRARRTPGGDLHDLRRCHARARLEEEPAAGQGRRAPTSAWSIRRSTRWRSRASNPDSEVVFFGARLRDDDAEHGADRAAGRAPRASRTSRCSATTSRSSRRSRRSSTRPTCSSTASSAPATSAW